MIDIHPYDPYTRYPAGAVIQDGDGDYFQASEDGDWIPVSEQELVEGIAHAEAATEWISWMDAEMEKLQEQLDRPLSNRELEDVFDHCQNHPNHAPDVGEAFDHLFPDRRTPLSQDPQLRNELATEYAQDAQDKAKEEEADEPEDDWSPDTSKPRAEQIEEAVKHDQAERETAEAGAE